MMAAQLLSGAQGTCWGICPCDSVGGRHPSVLVLVQGSVRGRACCVDRRGIAAGSASVVGSDVSRKGSLPRAGLMRPSTSTCCRLTGEDLTQCLRTFHKTHERYTDKCLSSTDLVPCAVTEARRGTRGPQPTSSPLRCRWRAGGRWPGRGGGRRQMTEKTRSLAFAEHVGLSLPLSSPLSQLSSDADHT